MICTVISQLIVGLGSHAIIYEKNITFILVVFNFLNAFWCFLLILFTAMVFTYVVQIKAELVEIMNENVQLFDKIHEGIVLVSKSED